MNTAAQALGRMARGVPKQFSAAELARRSARLAEARAKRWAGRKKIVDQLIPDGNQKKGAKEGAG